MRALIVAALLMCLCVGAADAALLYAKNTGTLTNGASRTSLTIDVSRGNQINVALQFTRGATYTGPVTLTVEGSIDQVLWATWGTGTVTPVASPTTYVNSWLVTSPDINEPTVLWPSCPFPYIRLMVTNSSGASITAVSYAVISSN